MSFHTIKVLASDWDSDYLEFTKKHGSVREGDLFIVRGTNHLNGYYTVRNIRHQKLFDIGPVNVSGRAKGRFYIVNRKTT